MILCGYNFYLSLVFPFIDKSKDLKEIWLDKGILTKFNHHFMRLFFLIYKSSIGID